MNLILLKINKTVEAPPPAPRSFIEQRVDEFRYLSNSSYNAFKGAATRLAKVPRYLPIGVWVVSGLVVGALILLVMF